MKRYVVTSLAIGMAVLAVVCLLFFVGAFEWSARWLSDLYATRGFFPPEQPLRPKWLEVAVAALAAFGVSWSVVDISRVPRKVLVFFLLSISILGISPTLALYGLLFDPAAPLAAAFLAGAAGIVYAGTEPGMRKRILEEVLGPRVSRRTFEELLEAPGPPDFGGAVREVTVVTCRLFNHVELREKLEPGELTKMSNLFLRSVSTFLLSRGAYLDESGPDLVRVFFGMLKPSDDHASEACRAALELRSRLRNLSRECETRWFQKLHYGIGISSGPVTVGIYGAPHHYFYSGIGADTDLSRRLAHANFRYGSCVLLAPRTHLLVKEEFELRPMEMFYDPETDVMKEIFELLSAEESFSDADRERRDFFWTGMIYFRERKYEEALDHFSRSRNPAAEDPPLEFFITRAQLGVSEPDNPDVAKVRELTEEGHARLIGLM